MQHEPVERTERAGSTYPVGAPPRGRTVWIPVRPSQLPLRPGQL